MTRQVGTVALETINAAKKFTHMYGNIIRVTLVHKRGTLLPGNRQNPHVYSYSAIPYTRVYAFLSALRHHPKANGCRPASFSFQTSRRTS